MRLTALVIRHESGAARRRYERRSNLWTLVAQHDIVRTLSQRFAFELISRDVESPSPMAYGSVADVAGIGAHPPLCVCSET